MSTYYHICPRCGAHLDPGERCDCQSAAPGGYPSGNRTSTKSGRVRKADGCKKFTHAENAPVQIVHPSLPGLPEIMQDCPLDAMPCTGDCPDTTCPRHLCPPRQNDTPDNLTGAPATYTGLRPETRYPLPRYQHDSCKKKAAFPVTSRKGGRWAVFACRPIPPPLYRKMEVFTMLGYTAYQFSCVAPLAFAFLFGAAVMWFSGIR